MSAAVLARTGCWNENADSQQQKGITENAVITFENLFLAHSFLKNKKIRKH